MHTIYYNMWNDINYGIHLFITWSCSMSGWSDHTRVVWLGSNKCGVSLLSADQSFCFLLSWSTGTFYSIRVQTYKNLIFKLSRDNSEPILHTIKLVKLYTEPIYWPVLNIDPPNEGGCSKIKSFSSFSLTYTCFKPYSSFLTEHYQKSSIQVRVVTLCRTLVIWRAMISCSATLAYQLSLD